MMITKKSFKMAMVTLLLVMVLPLFSSSHIYGQEQEGVKFEEGSWSEVLAKAKKLNRLVFVDVYTDWCGPCKMMVQNVFPQKVVGDFFNANFVNYKIDAEKGEGVEIARRYRAQAYPTYLFVSGDGVLYYSFTGYRVAEKFIEESQKALDDFNNPESLTLLESQYEERKNDKEFLLTLMSRRHVRDIPVADIAEQLLTVMPKEELLTEEVLTPILNTGGLKADGIFVKFVLANTEEIASALGHPHTKFVQSMVDRQMYGETKRAIEEKNEALLPYIVKVQESASMDESKKGWIESDVYSRYYAEIGDERNTIKYLRELAANMLSYDISIIEKADAKELAQFEEQVKAGAFAGAPKEQIDMMRSLSKSASTSYAYGVRDIVKSAVKAVNDKTLLNEALYWIEVAGKYSENFTIDEVKGSLLHKLGRGADALKATESAIAKYSMINMKNEPIETRLNNQLKTIKSSY